MGILEHLIRDKVTSSEIRDLAALYQVTKGWENPPTPFQLYDAYLMHGT